MKDKINKWNKNQKKQGQPKCEQGKMRQRKENQF